MNGIAVGYVRLSAADPGGNSIPNQKRRVEEYCTFNKLELLQVFVDDGKTGWNFDRPGFIEMERFCKANRNVQYLIIPHFDRFSRADPVDAMVKERYIRDKLGVKVLQISEPLDTDTTSSTYQIMRFMQAFASNEERNRIVDRTRNGVRYNLMQGRFSGNPPFGFIRGRDVNGKPLMQIDESKGHIIKLIYREYLHGLKIEEVKKLAAKKGFNIHGNSAIQKVLSNPVYAGMVRLPAYKSQPEKLVKGLHTGLVTESQYWQAQEMLSGKAYGSHPSESAVLRGVLRCHCGRKLTAAPSKGKSGKFYWYYFCKEHRKDNLSAVKLHEQFYDMLDNLSLNKSDLLTIRERLTEVINDHLANRSASLMQVRHQLGKVTRQIESTEEKFLLQPDISQVTYRKVMTSQRSEQHRLQEELNKLEQDSKAYWDRLNEVLPLLTDLKEVFLQLDINKKHAFIRWVFDQNLAYYQGKYRTPSIEKIFEHNLLKVKEKGLLEIEKPLPENDDSLLCRPQGSMAEHLLSLAAIIAA